jgi:hypothetical protein
MNSPPPINASPTKEFFIKMLIRDVKLGDAISELVDNSVDGAKRLRPDGDFTGLEIILTLNEKSFEIKDNCGGISVDVAQDYAFRFGRTETMPDELKTKRPIGQFGVGMKRALFKLGKSFVIMSVSPNSSFVVEIDVEKWKHEKIEIKNKESNGNGIQNPKTEEEISESIENWTFDFKNYEVNQNNPPNKCGTTISVTQLDESIAGDFKRKNFQNSLGLAISAQQGESLEKGLAIKLNGSPLRSEREKLVETDEIKPLHILRIFPADAVENDPNKVTADIYAGVSAKTDYSNAGWSIYCNGRLVLDADKNNITGWGEEREMLEEDENLIQENNNQSDVTVTPRAHSQFSRFRGFVYFESDNAELLPWNTSKTGINVESPIYRSVRLDMIRALRQIIDFLNLVKNDAERGEARYSQLLNRAAEIVVSQNIPVAEKFIYPSQEDLPPATPKTQKINYSKPYEAVERAKRLLDVMQNKEVGERTFDYFMSREDSEDV